MATEQIIYNINKIDSDLKNLFESVTIKEKNVANKFFFEVKAESKFRGLKESNDYVKAEVIVLIEKRNLVFNPIKWLYSTNPNNPKADWLEKESTMETISRDIHSILTKRRMDQSYFESLVSISENTKKVTPKKQSKPEDKFVVLLNESGVNVTRSEKVVIPHMENFEFMNRPADITWRFFHDNDIKVSERFRIESEFEKRFGANWTRFKEGFVEVNFYN